MRLLPADAGAEVAVHHPHDGERSGEASVHLQRAHVVDERHVRRPRERGRQRALHPPLLDPEVRRPRRERRGRAGAEPVQVQEGDLVAALRQRRGHGREVALHPPGVAHPVVGEEDAHAPLSALPGRSPRRAARRPPGGC